MLTISTAEQLKKYKARLGPCEKCKGTEVVVKRDDKGSLFDQITEFNCAKCGNTLYRMEWHEPIDRF